MPTFEDALDKVRTDIEKGIGKVFAPVEGSTIEPPQELARPLAAHQADVVAVPWVYRCVHVGNFQNLLPTGREIEMHGVTFVNYTKSEAKPRFHRYVDWLGVMNQLGLEVSWRVPIDEEEFGERLRDYRRMVREG